MCGIAGIGNYEDTVDRGTLDRMCRALEHRGPDSHGVHCEPGLGIGIQRLAIIDIEGGEQPIFNEDRSVAVVLNGEIYNHEELRQTLRARGHQFGSRCDTEVLVHLYEDHGEGLVEHLRGMFAFAIWDRRRRRLVCGRDRVGKKPLFWARQGSRFWFASELVALLEDPALPRQIDPRAIDAYLALQYVPHPLSVFKQVHKLPPASTLVIDRDTTSVSRYWRLAYSKPLTRASEQDLQEETWEQIKEATRIRLMSEVPLGAFLSGGIDSSAVVAAMAEQTAEPVKTFSIGFTDSDFDETPYARLVAERFGTDHHEFTVEPEAVEIFPRLARHYGEPFADSSAIPSFYLAELTRGHVTVALNGDGGDESFAGYGRYLRGTRIERLDWIPRSLLRSAPAVASLLGAPRSGSSAAARAQRLAGALASPPWERYAMSLTAFDRRDRKRLLKPEIRAELGDWYGERFLLDAWQSSSAEALVDVMLDTDIETYLPGDLLPKIDIATMAHSLEARSPFLDHRLMEFAASVPVEMKINGGDSKLLLKAALRGKIPDAVLDRPKMGFGVPLARWFREELRELPAERLLDPIALGRGYFDRGEVERLIAAHREGLQDNSLKIWVLLQLEMWHTEVLEAAPGTALQG